MAKQFTLGKKERLKSRKSIDQLFSEGKKINIAPYKVIYMLRFPVNETGLLFGTGVSAKTFKKAVARNRVKRVTREAYRVQKKILQEKVVEKKAQLHVFFIYTGKELPGYNDVYQKVGTALNKLAKLMPE